MSSDIRQMPALQTASIRSPSKRRLPRIAALVPFLPQATCRYWLCWTAPQADAKRLQTVEAGVRLPNVLASAARQWLTFWNE